MPGQPQGPPHQKLAAHQRWQRLLQNLAQDESFAQNGMDDGGGGGNDGRANEGDVHELNTDLSVDAPCRTVGPLRADWPRQALLGAHGRKVTTPESWGGNVKFSLPI